MLRRLSVRITVLAFLYSKIELLFFGKHFKSPHLSLPLLLVIGMCFECANCLCQNFTFCKDTIIRGIAAVALALTLSLLSMLIRTKGPRLFVWCDYVWYFTKGKRKFYFTSCSHHNIQFYLSPSTCASCKFVWYAKWYVQISRGWAMQCWLDHSYWNCGVSPLYAIWHGAVHL